MITVFIIIAALVFLGLVYIGELRCGAGISRRRRPPLVISADPLRHP